MTTQPAKSDFEALLGEITDLTKALPAEDTNKADAKVEAAAKDGEDVSDADKDGDDVAKSFKIKLEDGTELEAMDGAALFKSLSERVEKHEATSLTAVSGLLDVVKSLVGQVAALANKGTGRKAVLAVTEKPAAVADIAKSEPEGVSSDEFFAKALSLQAEGKISGNEVRRAEAYLNAGKPIPAEIITKVLSAK